MHWSRKVSVPAALGVAAAASYYAYEKGYRGSGSGRVNLWGSTPADQGAAYQGLSSESVGVHDAAVPEAVRKALLVDRGQLFTTEIPADQPISKDTDRSGKKLLEMLTPDQATAKLRTNEESYLVARGEGRGEI